MRRTSPRSDLPAPPGCPAGTTEAVARLDNGLAHPARLDREIDSGRRPLYRARHDQALEPKCRRPELARISTAWFTVSK